MPGGGGSQSSGGAGGGGQLDIIDLDRYMRGAVRPLPRRDLGRDRLVVDGGGGGGGAGGGSKASSSSSGRRRDKRYSHDSGLSDGSYLRSRHARHSRSANHPKRSETGGRSRRETREARGEGEATDLRSFRAACERALRDQQEQIARVAALCERLTASATQGRRPRASSSDVSELSSTSRSRSRSRSRSGRDERRRDTHRVANEYKTYKIIMSKLDDLNRRLAARAGGAGGAGGRQRGARGARRGEHSAGSSERYSRHTARAQGRTTRAPSRLVERAVGDANDGCEVTPAPKLRSPSVTQPSRAAEGVTQLYCAGVTKLSRAGSPEARSQLSRLSPRRAHDLDIAPRDALPSAVSPRLLQPRLNVATESVVQRSSSSSGESAHVFAQKRRKAPSRRSRSADAAGVTRKGHSKRSAIFSSAGSEQNAGGGLGVLGGLARFWRTPSLCYLCRSYWRALRHCIRHQFAPAL